MRTTMKILVLATAIFGLAAAPALAQMAPPPSAPGGMPRAESIPREKQVEGPVKKVDPAANTIQVGWFLGLLHTTLEVNDDTQIQSQGQKASLADIREGSRVKASYEVREGKNMAKSIEVIPAEAAKTAGRPMERPGTQTLPPIGAASR